MVNQYGFYYNSDLCAKCNVCAAACKDKNSTYAGIKYRRVIEYGGGEWTVDDKGIPTADNVYVYSISFACMHCKDPACTAACPTGAMTKREDGIVYVDQKVCIGCNYCVWACPYDAPRFNSALKAMGKCDFCKDLIDEGENPACVNACQMRAIEYGEISDLRAKYGTNADVAPLPSSSITNPSVVIKPSRWAGRPGRIISTEEELI